MELTPEEEEVRQGFRAFVEEHVKPHANRWDQEERLPRKVVRCLADARLMGATLRAKYGGRELNPLLYGLLNEELARGCSSLRSVLTVHDMSALAIQRWATPAQKERLLPRLVSGGALLAFALSEPGVGSDAAAVTATATPVDGGYRINGHKKWMTGGQLADIFLLIARCDGGTTAFLIERERAGLEIEPIRGLLGIRASMTAAVRLVDCWIPEENIIGKMGFGFSHVASTALDLGRFAVAWGCVGIAQACLESAMEYASRRVQFDRPISQHQLVQRMLTDMLVNTTAARLMCMRASHLRRIGDPRAITQTSMAKYFASTVLSGIAHDAVQVHGASGCSTEHAVQRYLRDARIMEIIEGTTEIHQVTLAQQAQQLL